MKAIKLSRSNYFFVVYSGISVHKGKLSVTTKWQKIYSLSFEIMVIAPEGAETSFYKVTIPSLNL